MKHLLVTNDYPPKIGGIQNYLWELWRRLPPGSTAVYCTPYDGSQRFDAAHPHPIERSPEPVLLPYPWLARRIDALAERAGADLVILDPAVPLGLVGPHLRRPYATMLHGAEVAIPGRLPGLRSVLARVLDRAAFVIANSRYALDEGERCVGRPLASVVVPPGVDRDRFFVPTAEQRILARRRFGFADDAFVIASVNRLVPRKGMDLLIAAADELHRRHGRVTLAVGGTGRQADDLAEQAAQVDVDVRLLGRIDDPAVPALYQGADAMAMLCHERWFGLEQEGFGISFLEAAACGVPQVAGRSGGAHEAVVDGVTGFVVDDPTDAARVADRLETLRDPEVGMRLGTKAAARVERDFDQQNLADRLDEAIRELTP